MTKTKTRKVRIIRDNWLRGTSQTYGNLMADSDGCMCCLGFIANQISSIPKSRLLNNSTPEDVYRKASILTIITDEGYVVNNQLAEKAITINDDEEISDKYREMRLKSLFKRYDLEIEFV